VRAKGKIKDANIPYEVPEAAQRAERLDGVLRTIYLVFNEGYSASSGASLTRADLSAEAIRLGRLRWSCCRSRGDGLLALHAAAGVAARGAHARVRATLIVLEDRTGSWNRELIAKGSRASRRGARARAGFRTLHLQAAIAAVHAEAREPRRDGLERDRGPSTTCCRESTRRPVIELNRAGGGGHARRSRRGAGASSTAILARGELAGTTWPTRRGRTCAGAWARREARSPTRRRSRFPSRSRNGGSWRRRHRGDRRQDDVENGGFPFDKGRHTRLKKRRRMKYLCLVYATRRRLAGMDDRHCVAYDEKIRASGSASPPRRCSRPPATPCACATARCR
jgi:predicted RNA polymerase sigma factor